MSVVQYLPGGVLPAVYLNSARIEDAVAVEYHKYHPVIPGGPDDDEPSRGLPVSWISVFVKGEADPIVIDPDHDNLWNVSAIQPLRTRTGRAVYVLFGEQAGPALLDYAEIARRELNEDRDKEYSIGPGGIVTWTNV